MGLLVNNINAQFACIRDESIKSNFCLSQWNDFRNINGVSEATRFFKDEIEICDDNTLNTRINYANTIYAALKTK